MRAMLKFTLEYISMQFASLRITMWEVLTLIIHTKHLSISGKSSSLTCWSLGQNDAKKSECKMLVLKMLC